MDKGIPVTIESRGTTVAMRVADLSDPRLAQLIEGALVNVTITLQVPTEEQAQLLGKIHFYRVESEEPTAEHNFSDEQITYLAKRVDELELTVYSTNRLQDIGTVFVWQICERSKTEMLKTKNFGRKSVNEIEEALAEMDLDYGMRAQIAPIKGQLPHHMSS